MAGFKISKFTGIRPRLPESFLTEGAASVAENCDFAYGELRNTKGGFEFLTLSNTPKSIYTEDGLSFFSWEKDVDAVRSPLANDFFNRMYYSGDGGIRVANRLDTRISGGPPSSSYIVGVPRPTVAPVLSVQGITPIEDLDATFEVWFHYEYGGVKYQETDITSYAPITPENTLCFTPPAIEEGTNASAFPVLRCIATSKADNSRLFDIYTENSSFDSSGLYHVEMSKDPGADSYTAAITVGIEEADKETRAYVYTYVNSYNEEGAPSPPATVTTSPVVGVDVSVTQDANGSIGYAPVKEIRVYRTPTSSETAAYFYVGTIPLLAGSGSVITFSDTVDAALMNEELSSLYSYPPNPSLTGLMSLPNGILAAWKGNELHFSDPYRPWSWPPSYVKTVPSNIVGAIIHGSGAVVTTATHPYWLTGISPESMTLSKINIDQAGVSKWSIAVVDGTVVYASHDGLVAISGATGSLSSGQAFFTREVWRKRYASGLSSMRFAVWDGRLVVFSGAKAFAPFMIRFDEADGSMTDLPGLVAQSSFVSPLSDQFYYTNGRKLYQFMGGAGDSAKWESGENVLKRPCNYGIASVLADGNWEVRFYAWLPTGNGVEHQYKLKHTQSITAGVTTFRLPSGFESDRYKISITGQGRFRELRVAQSSSELANL